MGGWLDVRITGTKCHSSFSRLGQGHSSCDGLRVPKGSKREQAFFKSLLLTKASHVTKPRVIVWEETPWRDVNKLGAITPNTYHKHHWRQLLFYHSYIVLSSWIDPFPVPSLGRFQREVLTQTFLSALNLIEKAFFCHHFTQMSRLGQHGDLPTLPLTEH